MKTIKLSNEFNISPYSDEDLKLSEDMQEKIEKLIKFFDEYGIDYDKFDVKSIPKLDFDKKDAYPNNDQFMFIPNQHDTKKWINAISEIYNKEQQGDTRVQSIRRVTSGWNIMEIFDFLNWVKFYESGGHMKYKTAQLWYENDSLGPGYFLEVKKDKMQDVDKAVDSGQNIDFAREQAANNSEKRQTIEKQRNKIIGRLDSAEKLLRSPDGHTFSGKEFESLLETIYQLKKKIQMVNKISSSNRLYEDMIIREANILSKKGFIKASDVIYSLAQTPVAVGEKADGNENGKNIPLPATPGDPSGAGHPGAPGGLPSMGPGMPQGAPPSAAPEGMENDNSPAPEGIEKFLAGLNDGQYSPTDKQVAEDDLEVEDNELVVEAQMAIPTGPIDEPMTSSPMPEPLNPSPVDGPESAPLPVKETVLDEPLEVIEEPLEVTEHDIPKEEGPNLTSNFDAKVDSVFSDITISDVVAKLEDLAKIFKTREIPRQLSIVDMMLDSLGLASYFPSLSEAINKSLEGNNYISTRVDDILSNLRGAMPTKEIDLKGNSEENDKVPDIKNKLKEDSEKEKARKQMRKDQENLELTNKRKETPEIEIEEDLQTPLAPAPVNMPEPVKLNPLV